MLAVRQHRKPYHQFVDMSAVQDEARSADRAGMSATGVSRSEMESGVCPRSDLWTSKDNPYWILSATGSSATLGEPE